MRVHRVPEGSQAYEFPADHTRVWVQKGLASSHKAKATLCAMGPSPHTLPLSQSWQSPTVSPGKLTLKVKPKSWELQDAARVRLAPPKQNKQRGPAHSSAEHRAAGAREAQTLPLAQPAALASGHSACCWTGARQARQGSPARSCAAIWGPAEEPLLTRVRAYGPPLHSALLAPKSPNAALFHSYPSDPEKPPRGPHLSGPSSISYAPFPKVSHTSMQTETPKSHRQLALPTRLTSTCLYSTSHSPRQPQEPYYPVHSLRPTPSLCGAPALLILWNPLAALFLPMGL